MRDKPEIEIHNWHLLDGRLFGDAKGHPRLGDQFIRSSTVLKVDREDGIVATRNTIYRLIGSEKVQGEPTNQTQSIARVRTLAEEARKQYHADLTAGCEPTYPAWIDDVLAVCEMAESAVGQ